MTTKRNWRISERRAVPTTPITWKVPKRRVTGGLNKPAHTEAAIVDVSTVGVGIVCPKTWVVNVGDVVDVAWNGMVGTVKVRRVAPLEGSDHLLLYGVEFTSGSAATMGSALYEHLVGLPRRTHDGWIN
jgi:hypothetical protein